ncbi:TetR/AcrR family transcriptional regulator [Vogesella alkaliphila]|uniref:TetR family transcriptional regulator n=1 Tax=Vogesella alkaliphila TaxID=1193621 RepID=A0ABQ2YYU8_9NEIS|nr:TetR/AcrR family transcriptional regulator [Vogesella alkaliphila]GGX98355.1 TetR family transcriptional regulator [Vogesella alkaliphila]
MQEPSRRERKQQESADHISRIAMALFAERGYVNITMEEIARAADVAKGTLYSRFPVKEAILSHFILAEMRDAAPALMAQLQTLPDCRTRLQRYFRHGAHFAQQYRDYLRPYLQYRFGQVFQADRQRSNMGQILTALLGEGMADGEIRRDIPLPQQVLALEMHYVGVLMAWLSLDGLDLAALLDTMLTLFLDGAEVRDAA